MAEGPQTTPKSHIAAAEAIPKPVPVPKQQSYVSGASKFIFIVYLHVRKAVDHFDLICELF